MNKREKQKMINHLLDIKESVDYLRERVRLAKGNDLEILYKNLHYALRKEEDVCKKTGCGDLTNLLKTLQQEEV
jgi:hypothetical protein